MSRRVCRLELARLASARCVSSPSAPTEHPANNPNGVARPVIRAKVPNHRALDALAAVALGLAQPEIERLVEARRGDEDRFTDLGPQHHGREPGPQIRSIPGKRCIEARGIV